MVVSDGSRCFRAEILSDPVLRNHIWPDIGSLRADEVPRAILFGPAIEMLSQKLTCYFRAMVPLSTGGN